MRQLIETGEVATARDAPSGDAPQGQRLAVPLGWVSLGLGAAEVGAPRTVTRLVGAPARTAVVRALGARELAAGVGILARRGRAGWLWSRVGGDVMDLALLGVALTAPGANRKRIAAAAAAVAGIAALDFLSSRAAMREQRRESAPPVPRSQSETFHTSNVQ
jgi:hypothetical protein